jgi:hypothetical protein
MKRPALGSVYGIDPVLSLCAYSSVKGASEAQILFGKKIELNKTKTLRN